MTDSEELPSSAVRLIDLPEELLIKVLAHLPASSVVECRRVCRCLREVTSASSLWLRMSDAWQRSVTAAQEGNSSTRQPLLPLRSSFEDDRTKAHQLRKNLLHAEQLHQRWNCQASEPQAVIRTRAHIDRITCMKIVSGKRGRYLITGAVDGWARVWQLSDPLPADSNSVGDNGTEQKRYPEEVRDLFSSSSSALLHRGSTSPSFDSLTGTPIDPPWQSAGAGSSPSVQERKRQRKQILLAEVDTGGDITCIDAEMNQTETRLICAVGSYYSSSSCMVYQLYLDKKPCMLDRVATLEPREWYGTQCVSLRGDVVAVGTYVGVIHVFDWHEGWRAKLDRGMRASSASIKLLADSVISVTRSGSIEVFALPEEDSSEGDLSAPTTGGGGQDSAQQRSSPVFPRASLLDDSQPVASELNLLDQQQEQRKGGAIARTALEGIMRPLLQASFSEDEAHRQGTSDFHGSDSSAPQRRLYLQVVDARSVTHYVFDPVVGRQPFPWCWPPRVVGRATTAWEHSTGGALGATGTKGILMTNLAGGVPPISCIRLVSRCDVTAPTVDRGAIAKHELAAERIQDEERMESSDREPEGDGFGLTLVALRPTADVGIPPDPSYVPPHARSPVPLGALATAGGFPPAAAAAISPVPSLVPSPAAHPSSGVDSSPSSLSSTSSTGVASTPAPTTARADILTEICFDEAAGIVCIGTARGNLFIADFGRPHGPPPPAVPKARGGFGNASGATLVL